jgi:hypothetical protein
MPYRPVGPPFDRFLAAAEAVARERPDVDPELARELFEEVATLLYNGLVLDELDEHDAEVAVAALCTDLVAADPGTAVSDRARAVAGSPGDLHDPEAVSAALLMAAAVLRL